MPHPHRLPQLLRQDLRRLHRVLDLPPIEPHACQHVQVRIRQVPLLVGQAFDEIRPDLTARGAVELRVIDGDVDSGFEGRVERVDAVGRQDEEAVVVFKQAEED